MEPPRFRALTVGLLVVELANEEDSPRVGGFLASSRRASSAATLTSGSNFDSGTSESAIGLSMGSEAGAFVT